MDINIVGSVVPPKKKQKTKRSTSTNEGPQEYETIQLDSGPSRSYSVNDLRKRRGDGNGSEEPGRICLCETRRVYILPCR